MSAKFLPHGSNRVYNSTGSSTASAAPGYEKQLSLRGILIGTITERADRAGNLTNDVGLGLNVLTDGPWHRMAFEKASTDGIYLPTGEAIKLAYSRLRIGDHIWGEPRAEDRRRRLKTVTSILEPGPLSFSVAMGRVISPRDDVGTLIIKWTTRQRLYVTDTGYMGLCHWSCQLSDQVFLLMGGEMPFVLRKRDSGTFQLKGESYVHGVMDGEHLIKNFKPKADPNATMSDEHWLGKLCQEPLPFETQTVILD